MQLTTLIIWIALISMALILSLTKQNKYIRNEHLYYLKGQTHGHEELLKFNKSTSLFKSSITDNTYWIYYALLLFGTIFALCWFLPLNIVFIIAGTNAFVCMLLIIKIQSLKSSTLLMSDLFHYMKSLEIGVAENIDATEVFIRLLNSNQLSSSFKGDVKDVVLALKNDVPLNECLKALNLKYSNVPYFCTFNELYVRHEAHEKIVFITTQFEALPIINARYHNKVKRFERYSFIIIGLMLSTGLGLLVAYKLNWLSITLSVSTTTIVVAILLLSCWWILKQLISLRKPYFLGRGREN